jgi:hypothetical protein
VRCCCCCCCWRLVCSQQELVQEAQAVQVISDGPCTVEDALVCKPAGVTASAGVRQHEWRCSNISREATPSEMRQHQRQ